MSVQVVVDGVVVYNQSDRLGQIVKQLEQFSLHLATIESLAEANQTVSVLQAIQEMRNKVVSDIDDLKTETASLLQSIADETAAVEAKLGQPNADLAQVTSQLHDARMTIEAETAKLQGTPTPAQARPRRGE